MVPPLSINYVAETQVESGGPHESDQLEQARSACVVADHHALGLAVMVQRHLVRFATYATPRQHNHVPAEQSYHTKAALLVPAKSGVRRVQVVAVDPHAPGLDLSGYL